LVIFAYFTAVGLMFFGYRYLEYVANREAVSPLEPFINEVLTGAWMAALLFPLVARFARRYPFDRVNWRTRLPLHVGALVVYSLAHTSLLWLLRNTLYPLFGLRHYDYGDMTARYPMELFHDVIVYTVIVSLLHLFDRHVRSAQIETQLAHARLENLRLQLQPHFLFNTLNTISAVPARPADVDRSARHRDNGRMKPALAVLLALTTGTVLAAQTWTAYGGDAGGTRYSPLHQITSTNVTALRVAWSYRTGALEPKTALNDKAAFEATPIVIDGTLYLTTPFNQVIALDPGSGAARWTYDPKIDRARGYSEVTSRGVAAWIDPASPVDAPCRLRIFEGTIDARLIGLDGKTGKPCASFGDAGVVDLTRDVGLRPAFRGDYQVTSAPTIVGDRVIVGASIGDNGAVDMPRGVVRAFDARTGLLQWTWDPIPWAGAQQVRTGAANAWSTFAADPARDLVFIPTGSASPDYYGGARPGDDKWANSVVALRASTGELVWGFQVVHHDLWDYDVPSQPTLIDVRGRPAVAVTTKIGHVFVLDRLTGTPLHAVDERPVPSSDIPGETASTTQPIPAWSAMVPQRLTAADAWGRSPDMRQWCREKIESLRNDGLFTPPSLRGTLSFPGNIGGVNWGGAAWDPARHLLIANTNRIAAIMQLIPREAMQGAIDRRKDTETSWGGEFAPQRGTPYAMHREWLVAPNRQPCNPPPWGALVAFDVETGTRRWETPLGTMGDGWPPGSISLGGPMVTAGGLIFTAAALDPHLRAFDAATGKELWSVELPAAAQSTPMTYEWNGRQYIVICAGGHGKMGSKMGDSVVALALE
jgi:quinoprotein glucose dehydrogenase